MTLCNAPSARGASWGDDGNIIVALENFAGLSRVPSAGGTPVPVTKLNAGETTHRWSQVLRGSQAVLFTASTGRGNHDDAITDALSLQTGERKTVARGGISPGYMPAANGTGHLLYLHQSTLFAAPFDAGRMATTGSPGEAVYAAPLRRVFARVRDRPVTHRPMPGTRKNGGRATRQLAPFYTTGQRKHHARPHQRWTTPV